MLLEVTQCLTKKVLQPLLLFVVNWFREAWQVGVYGTDGVPYWFPMEVHDITV